ncbi:MAG TPA: GNAT family N-acetyltransferase [Mycobacteriales bacterium]|nr:GNAT family N-acetyltransferase [Mycobacteriales bacterium]
MSRGRRDGGGGGLSVFETERLRAREWTTGDAEAAFEIYRDPEVVRYLGSVPQPVESVEAMRARIEGWLERNAATRDRGMGVWALETRDGTLLGMTLLKPLPDAEEVEVGWHLGRAFWGHGYATEGARGAIGYGFETVGLDTVYAVIVAENAASLAVARRLGMTYEGPTDRYYGRTLELFSMRA